MKKTSVSLLTMLHNLLLSTDMKTGLNDRASGSAYVELGATKVMCAV